MEKIPYFRREVVSRDVMDKFDSVDCRLEANALPRVECGHTNQFRQYCDKDMRQYKQVRKCPLGCIVSHQLNRCFKYRSLSINEKWEMAIEHKVCFKCFEVGHVNRTCTSKISCRKCIGGHNTLLHRDVIWNEVGGLDLEALGFPKEIILPKLFKENSVNSWSIDFEALGLPKYIESPKLFKEKSKNTLDIDFEALGLPRYIELPKLLKENSESTLEISEKAIGGDDVSSKAENTRNISTVDMKVGKSMLLKEKSESTLEISVKAKVGDDVFSKTEYTGNISTVDRVGNNNARTSSRRKFRPWWSWRRGRSTRTTTDSDGLVIKRQKTSNIEDEITNSGELEACRIRSSNLLPPSLIRRDDLPPVAVKDYSSEEYVIADEGDDIEETKAEEEGKVQKPDGAENDAAADKGVSMDEADESKRSAVEEFEEDNKEDSEDDAAIVTEKVNRRLHLQITRHVCSVGSGPELAKSLRVKMTIEEEDTPMSETPNAEGGDKMLAALEHRKEKPKEPDKDVSKFRRRLESMGSMLCSCWHICRPQLQIIISNQLFN